MGNRYSCFHYSARKYPWGGGRCTGLHPAYIPGVGEETVVVVSAELAC
jgi:hypothetical protein